MIENKIKKRQEVAGICRDLQGKGKKIGFTSGSFDLLHYGHASYLEKAKSQCDVLAVGINSDKSVRRYKGEGRPVIGEDRRIRLVSALESVDFAFIFDERRNRRNIELLDPDFYFKAGDYAASELTSAKYLKRGRAIIIPPVEGISTSEILERINTPKHTKLFPAVFIDRDGVINEEVHFLHEPERFKMLPKVIEGLKVLKDMKYKLVIITNQAGIGLGYFSKEDFFKVNSRMLKEFTDYGITIDKIYFCHHTNADGCDCRKPKIGMYMRAVDELGIELKNSFSIGDKTSDILAGQNAGTRNILVQTGHAGKDMEYPVEPDFTASDFLEAVQWIKLHEQD